MEEVSSVLGRQNSVAGIDAVGLHRAQLEQQERARREEVARSAMLRRIPRRFHEARFATYHPRNETQERALQAAQRWVVDLLKGEQPRLALIGPKGLGKSHLLYSAAWALFDGYPEARTLIMGAAIVRWYKFTDELRYGRGDRDERGNPKVRPHEVRQEWWNAPLSLIDEVRPTSSTDHDATEVARYVHHAYDEEVPVFLCTPFADLEKLIGEQAADRFTVVGLTGESYR